MGNVRPERVERGEGCDKRLVRRPVAGQVEDVAHRQREGRVDLERRVRGEGQHQSVQPETAGAGDRPIRSGQCHEIIRVADRFVERQPHNGPRIDLNGAVDREDRQQTRRIVVSGGEAGNKRRHQRPAHQVGRAASDDSTQGVLPLAIDDDDLVSLFALQRRERRKADQARHIVGRVEQQLDCHRDVAGARVEPKINAIEIEAVGRQGFVEEKLNRRGDWNSHRGIGRNDPEDAGVVFVERHVAEVQPLSIARQRRGQSCNASDTCRDGFEVERSDGNVRQAEQAAAISADHGAPWQAALRSEGQQDINARHWRRAVGAHETAAHRATGADGENHLVPLAGEGNAAVEADAERRSLRGQAIRADRDVGEIETTVHVGQRVFRVVGEQRRLNGEHYRCTDGGSGPIAEQNGAGNAANARQDQGEIRGRTRCGDG